MEGTGSSLPLRRPVEEREMHSRDREILSTGQEREGGREEEGEGVCTDPLSLHIDYASPCCCTSSGRKGVREGAREGGSEGGREGGSWRWKD